MADRDTSIPGNQIRDDSINQTELDITNIPTDGQIVKINMPAGDFTAIDLSSVGAFRDSFTNADLSSGILTITHNLSVQYVVVRIYDNNDLIIEPDDFTATDSNTLTVDLTTFGTLTGTWNISIVTGSLGSGSSTSIQDADGDTKIQTEESANENIIRFDIAGTEQIILQDGAILPTTDDDIDLGSSAKKFKELFLTGASLHLGDTTITEDNYNKTQDNIVLNAFRIAINGSLTQFNMIDGIVDEYEDENSISVANQKLLLHCNGSDASTTIIDDSPNPHTITVNGDAQLDTAIKKFGTASLLLDGTGDYLSIPDSTDWDVFASTSEDWTIDFWINLVETGTDKVIVGQFEDINNRWDILINDAELLRFRFISSVATNLTMSSSTTLSASTQIHIAIIKVGTDYGIYINGVQDVYASSSAIDTFAGSLFIGSRDGTTDFLNGSLDELSIQKSNIFSADPVVGLTDTITIPVSEYTTETGTSSNQSYDSVNDLYSPINNFPTSEYSSDANTQLLLHFNGADASTTITDDGNTGHSPTVVNNAQLDTAQKQFGTASLLLDGVDDYVTIPDSSDWDFGTGDFTVEGWFRWNSITSPSNNQNLLSSISAGKEWFFGKNASKIFMEFSDSGGVGNFTINFVPSENVWYHIAWVRNGSTGLIFINGISQSVTTVTSFGTLPNVAGAITIGGATNDFNGWIDEIRISKGLARYTSDFDLTENMTLQSINFTAVAQPDSARIVLFEEDVDSIALNTDLIAKVSRDGGTTFSTVTLANDGEYESGKNILTGSVDISGQPSGTEILYKIETANNKDLNIHGTGLSWD